MKNKALLVGAAYGYVHFAIEALCFYLLFKYMRNDGWWLYSLMYDTLAFGLQPFCGKLCERIPRFRPGIIAMLLLIFGALMITALSGNIPALWIGMILISLGNAFGHINGAMATLRVSEGRLTESAIFVGGGSFGLIVGRLAGANGQPIAIYIALIVIALAVICIVDNYIRKTYGEMAYDFEAAPCRHDIAVNRNALLVVLILSLVIMVRSYIGYGLPTAWNQTVVQSIFLYCAMGIGKMLGGILADIIGPRTVGVASCILSAPVLLVSNNLMWLSLIGVALFAMTMSVTLGGLVSVLKKAPGTAFGITTVSLLLGTLPLFFIGMPEQKICNILIALLSVLAAVGLYITIRDEKEKKVL